MQGLFSLSFDKKLYFYCFLNLCVKCVYYNLLYTKSHIIKTGFVFFFFIKKDRRFVRYVEAPVFPVFIPDFYRTDRLFQGLRR